MKNKQKIIGSIAILGISIVFIIFGYLMSKPKQDITTTDYKDVFLEVDKVSEKKEDKQEPVSQTKSIEKNNYITVDIKGAVRVPRDYKLKEGSRVRELIELAGGVTEEADLNTILFSKKLRDEDCIIIYKKGEIGEIQNLQGNLNSSVVSTATNKDTIININTATIEELKTLTGIGDSKAQAIIQYREENGGFKSVEELTKVSGIGEKTLSKFIDKVDID